MSDIFPGSIIVPPVYPDPTFQNVNTVPFGYAYGEGNDDLDHQPPTAPTNLRSSAITTTGVTLNWDAAYDDNRVDHYAIYQDGSILDTRVGTQMVVTGLTTKTTYHFTVAAFDGHEQMGDMSNQVTVTTS